MLMTMFNPKFCLFGLLEVLCIFLVVGDSKLKSCIEIEKQALLKLKDGFIDEWGILSSWRSEVDCYKWNGISCNNFTAHVTKLDLKALNHSIKLRGNIDPSLCQLQHLTCLDLSFNNFEGEVIPKCIGSLCHLRELRLKNANFISTIPNELQNLSNLQTLDLGGNYHLSSNSLEWVSHLSSLRFLDLARVDLSRAINWQTSISRVPSLIELYLNYTQLPRVNPQPSSHLNASSHLKVLTLRGNHLSSSTLSWVFNLSKVLKHLDLSDNSLQYIAPHAFANMNSLEYLDLSNNKVESSIVKSICSLCQLKQLSLSFNKLSGRLSDWIQELCCAQNLLQKLDLSENPFISGPFPNLSTFSSLVTLCMKNTSLSGSIPQSFGLLCNLKHLDLSHNKLSGVLPKFTHLLSLETLDLSTNKFNGTLPITLGQLSSLDTLHLSSNELSGEISEAHLSTLSGLKVLDVSDNLFSFNFNSNWVPSFRLHQFSASSCNLGPNFPTWLKYQRTLELLYMSNSGIFDSIPEWFLNLSPSLTYLDLSQNKIHGAFPKLLSQQRIRFLDLSNNSLSGALPEDCWGQFEELEVLNLARNHFSGRIPNSMGTMNSIRTIHLNHNNLYGKIPLFVHSFKLQFIDFGHNNLHGRLPVWIGDNLPNLIGLSLGANKLQGTIPSNVCNLGRLQILDLSQNNIIGMIPNCLDNLFALTNSVYGKAAISYSMEDFDEEMVYNPFFIDSASLVYKGLVLVWTKTLGLVTTIDLSSNHLQGEIPTSITALVELHSLNLSRNNLTGLIPHNMGGELKVLGSLDLSRNSLSGGISADFSNMVFLGCLDLSFNNLSGEIPRGGQLETFEASSYKGNQGLCGSPLIQECPRDTDHSNSSNPDQLITFGFYVSMWFGFIVGFWGVCGTLILKSSWRVAYFQFFSNVSDWIYVQVLVSISRMKRRFQDNDD